LLLCAMPWIVDIHLKVALPLYSAMTRSAITLQMRKAQTACGIELPILAVGPAYQAMHAAHAFAKLRGPLNNCCSYLSQCVCPHVCACAVRPLHPHAAVPGPCVQLLSLYPCPGARATRYGRCSFFVAGVSVFSFYVPWCSFDVGQVSGQGSRACGP